MNVIRPQEQSFGTRVVAVEQPPAFGWVAYLISFARRRWPTMALAVMACLALGVVYVKTATPKYLAWTDLLIDIRRTDLLSQAHEVQDSQTLNAVLESQVEILRSEGLARQVVGRLNLLDDKQFNATTFSPIGAVRGWIGGLFGGGGGGDAAPVDRESMAAQQLMGMMSVRRIGLTYVIQISVKSTSPEEAARLANGLVDAYIVDQIAAKENTTREAGAWMQDRLRELKDQAMAADAVVQQYKAQKNIVDTDKGLMNEQQLAELNSQLGESRSRTSGMRARLDRITAIMQGNVTDATVTDGLQSNVINTLRQKYLDDSRQEAEWSAKFGASHNAVVKLQSEMREIQRAIRNELGRIAETYKSDYAVARADELAIEARMNELVGLTAKTNGDRVALRSLQSSADTYRSVYENFLTRYTQAVQDESFPISEARVITAAKPPLQKSEPRGNMVLGAAGMLGLGLGFAVAFIRESLDGSIRTAAQLRTITGLHCLGLLPTLHARSRRRGGPASTRGKTGARIIERGPGNLRLVLDQPKSAFAESIRTLRIRLCRGRSAPANMIGCISASSGEGASTVAANLAQFLANSGYQTLLVDLNAGPTSLGYALTPTADKGFLDVIAGTAPLEDVVWSDPETSLTFLPAGSRPPRVVASLVDSRAAQDVRAELRARYDYVIFDVPALSPVIEIHGATHLLDAFLLVVAWGRTTQDTLIGALNSAELDDARFVGTVLNGADLKAVRRYPQGQSERFMADLT